MATIRTSDRLNLAQALKLLKAHLPRDEAIEILTQAFVTHAVASQPRFAFPYDGAEIDWDTGYVTLPDKQDAFRPFVMRDEFEAYFFEDSMAGKSANRTYLAISKDEARKKLNERIEAAKPIFPGPIRTADAFVIAESQEKSWRAYNEELLRRMFTTDEYRDDYRGSVSRVHLAQDRYFDASLSDLVGRLLHSVQNQVARLQSIIDRLELIDEEMKAQPAESQEKLMASTSLTKVFVVHGHDEAALQSVARFVEKIGLEPVILKEQPDQGRTIIEKFEAKAAEVNFAIVLFTPDDLGKSVSGVDDAARARQNVIFELGYFTGKLGRGRACLMRKGNVEIPSDLYGVIYTELDAAEGWKMKLAKELRAAGYPVNLNKAVS